MLYSAAVLHKSKSTIGQIIFSERSYIKSLL